MIDFPLFVGAIFAIITLFIVGIYLRNQFLRLLALASSAVGVFVLATVLLGSVIDKTAQDDDVKTYTITKVIVGKVDGSGQQMGGAFILHDEEGGEYLLSHDVLAPGQVEELAVNRRTTHLFGREGSLTPLSEIIGDDYTTPTLTAKVPEG